MEHLRVFSSLRCALSTFRPGGGSWLLQDADKGSGLPQPAVHLFHRYSCRIEHHPVDLLEALPTVLYLQDAGPPFQGGFADIVSMDGKDSLCRIICTSREKRPACQQKYQDDGDNTAENSDFLYHVYTSP